ncbi:MAG: hypothetical protein ACREDR_32285 [Blastocatellia bacterium]
MDRQRRVAGGSADPGLGPQDHVTDAVQPNPAGLRSERVFGRQLALVMPKEFGSLQGVQELFAFRFELPMKSIRREGIFVSAVLPLNDEPRR